MQRTLSGTSQPMALDYGVKSASLAKLDAGQKLQIFDLTTRASRELHRWAARYPLIRRVRVWPLCLSVVAAAPFARLEALVIMAKMSLWIFTIDDLFDEEIVPFGELQRRVDRYKHILSGVWTEQRREPDSLAFALQSIYDDLKTYTLFPALHTHWATVTGRTLDGMMCEHEWRTMYRLSNSDAVLPAYDAYVHHAVYSIGGPPVMWSGTIAIDDQSVLRSFQDLQQLTLSASLCLRLANDLRSQSKEVLENNVNSIVIRQREAMEAGYSKQAALAKACATIQHDIQTGLTRCAELQQHIRTDTGYTERMVTDIARFVCDFYEHHDYHTFTSNNGRIA